MTSTDALQFAANVPCQFAALSIAQDDAFCSARQWIDTHSLPWPF